MSYDVVVISECSNALKLRSELKRKFNLHTTARKRRGGGVAILVSKEYQHEAEVVTNRVIEITFEDVFVSGKRLKVWGTYIPPETSTGAYNKNEREEFQRQVPSRIFEAENMNCCNLMMGDTNARVGN